MKKSRNEYSAAFIKNVKELSVYCVAYTGFGDVGFFKLRIQLNKQIHFEARIPIGNCPKPDAAAIVDFVIECFIKKIT